MKNVLTLIILLMIPFYLSSAQFSSDEGPWYAARVRDIAIGYKNGNSVIYAVNLSSAYATIIC